MNNKLENLVTKELLPLRITDYALEKGNLIARTTMELCKEYSLPTYEVAFYLLADREEAKSKRPLITDVYIAHEQEVSTDHCAIPGGGGITSSREIKYGLGMRVAGLAHSHADFNNFFSGRDVETFTRFVNDRYLFTHHEHEEPSNSKARFIPSGGKHHLEIGTGETIRIHLPQFDEWTLEQLNSSGVNVITHYENDLIYSYALVFNAKNEEPHAVLGYAEKNGKIHLKESVPMHIYESGKHAISEKDIIESQLIQRVVQLKRAKEEAKEKAYEHYKKARTLIAQTEEHFTNYLNGRRNKKKAEEQLMEGIQHLGNVLLDCNNRKDAYARSLQNYLLRSMDEFSEKLFLTQEILPKKNLYGDEREHNRVSPFGKEITTIMHYHGLYHARNKRNTPMQR